MDENAQQLRLLSIFHYVVGGITGLLASVPLIHLGIGLALLFAPELFKGNPPPPAIRWGLGIFFTLFGGIVVLAGWTIAGLLIAGGRCLARRQRLLFCQVVAGVGCLVFPFGTVLGVMTLLVLSRQSVRAMFERPPTGAR